MRLLILCVNYHSGGAALRFARDAAARLDGPDWRLLVIDNSERGDPQLSGLDGLHPQIGRHSNGQNLGYFGAAAAALAGYLRTHPLPDWVMVANADLRIDSDFGALQDLDADCAVVAPAIVSTFDGHDQNPYMRRRPSHRRMRRLRLVASRYALAQGYFLLYLLKKRLARWRRPGVAPVGYRMSIYAPHGACVLFARTYFAAGGSLDYGEFLFGEELFVAETARRLGLRVCYLPALRLRHVEHTSTGWWRSRRLWRYQKRSINYCFERFFAPGRGRAS